MGDAEVVAIAVGSAARRSAMDLTAVESPSASASKIETRESLTAARGDTRSQNHATTTACPDLGFWARSKVSERRRGGGEVSRRR